MGQCARLISSIFLPITYCVLDISFTVLSIGFYHSSWSFSSYLIRKKLFLYSGYSFITCPLDFIILSLIRFLILSFAPFYCWLLQKPKQYPTFLFGVQVCNFSFTLIKFLAFSDNPTQLSYPGLWFSIVWNLLSFALLNFIWKFIVSNYIHIFSQTHVNNNHYIPFSNGNQNSDDNDESLNTIIRSRAQAVTSTLRHIFRLLSYCMYYWGWILVGFTFLLIYSAARIFIPLCMAKTISSIVHKEELSKFIGFVIALVLLLLTATVFGGLRGGTLSYTTSKVNRKMRRDLFRSLTAQEIAFFDGNQTGEILSRLISDCEAMSLTVSTNLNIFLRNGVMAVGGIIFMLRLSWRLTMVTFVALPPIVFFTKLYSVYYDYIGKRTQELVAESNRVAGEVISSMRTVRSFACEIKEQRRYEVHLTNTLQLHKKRSLAFCGFSWITEFSNNIILFAIIFYGGYLVLTGKMSSDEIIAFLLYQLQLGENFYNLNSVITGLMESVGASRKVFEYLDRVPQIKIDGALKPPVEGSVKFSNVSFFYSTRPNTNVLKNVSFNINAGETVALVGPSGAGKSSIISLIERFYEPSSGSILIDNIPIELFEHNYYHEKIALVSQEPVLFAGSVRENILYGCNENVTDDEMITVAKMANVHDFVVALDGGYDTLCGEKGVQMSGGQKQRIAIARALMRNPVILILDEATSALDAESEYIVQEAIQKCSIGRTVIVIAHRLSTVERADRIVVVNKGSVVQVGTHSELMNNPSGLYFTLVQRQLFVENINN